MKDGREIYGRNDDGIHLKTEERKSEDAKMIAVNNICVRVTNNVKIMLCLLVMRGNNIVRI